MDEFKALNDDYQEWLNKPPTGDHDDKSYWYAQSYPVILSVFKDTHKKLEKRETWVCRIACMYSWLATIPAPDIDMNHVINAVKKIEEGDDYYDKNLRNIKEDTMSLDEALKSHYTVVNKLLNHGSKGTNNLASVSKFLHFMVPEVFPIYDKKVAEKVGYDIACFSGYVDYVQEMRAYLNSDFFVPDIQFAATPVRLIEWSLFDGSYSDEQS